MSPSSSSPVDDLSDAAAPPPPPPTCMRPGAKPLAAEGLMLPVVADREASGVVKCFCLGRRGARRWVALRWYGGGGWSFGRVRSGLSHLHTSMFLLSFYSQTARECTTGPSTRPPRYDRTSAVRCPRRYGEYDVTSPFAPSLCISSMNRLLWVSLSTKIKATVLPGEIAGLNESHGRKPQAKEIYIHSC